MDEKLIKKKENDDCEEQLNKQIKKMSRIKIINIIISIIRINLIFFAINSKIILIFFFQLPIFIYTISILIVIFFPIRTIALSITIILGTINRNFVIKKSNYFCYGICSFFFCHTLWCCFPHNVNYLKKNIISFFILKIFWIGIWIYVYFLRLFKIRLFIILEKDIIFIILLNVFDCLLLLCQSYIFSYYEYFLRRTDIYIEYYKRLIIKNKTEEANFIRAQLPYELNDYISTDAIELRNI